MIEDGLPIEATFVHVLASKYADHLPLYRQAEDLCPAGHHPDRSTPVDWAGMRLLHLTLCICAFSRLRLSSKLFAGCYSACKFDAWRIASSRMLPNNSADDWGGVTDSGRWRQWRAGLTRNCPPPREDVKSNRQRSVANVETRGSNPTRPRSLRKTTPDA
ncbi:transposase [Bradyrhizobium sp. SZCCHNR1018]|uniref:IS66 family transposase n=1 Tax=unclassified Bradyrhizobium TaxID=2631580 RepID=UPI0039657FC7